MSVNYNNVKKGCSTIFLGIIFNLVSMLSLIKINNDKFKFLEYFSFLSIVGIILMIIGCVKMRHENTNLGRAYKFLILSLITAILSVVATVVVAAVFQDKTPTWLPALFASLVIISSVANTLSDLFLITGITDAHTSKGNKSEANLGKRVKFYYLVPIIIGIVLNVITIILNKNVNDTILTVLSIISFVCEILGTATYIIFIGRSKSAF